MVACPACRERCGVADSVFFDQYLSYRCPRCSLCFDLDQIYLPTHEPGAEVNPEDGFEDEKGLATPLVPPPMELVCDSVPDDREDEVTTIRESDPDVQLMPSLPPSPSGATFTATVTELPRRRRISSMQLRVVGALAAAAAVGLVVAGDRQRPVAVPISATVSTTGADLAAPAPAEPESPVIELPSAPTSAPTRHAAPIALAPPPTTPTEQGTREGERALREGRVAQALSSFDRVLALNPSYVPARLGRADALWRSGRRVEARSVYHAIVLEVPDRFVPAVAKERAR